MKKESPLLVFLKNRIFKTVFKIVFVVGLLGFLASKGFLSFAKVREALTKWEYILPAFGMLLITTFFTILRWHVLLRAQGILLPLSRVAQLGMIGNFFNIALPGAVSGDVVKAIYVAREAPGLRARAFSSILFDRVAGVSILILVSAFALLFSLNQPWVDQVIPAIQLIVGASGASVIIGFTYLLTINEDRDPLYRFCERRAEKKSLIGSVGRIYIGIRDYHSHRSAVFTALLFSSFIHVLCSTTCVQFAYALGETQLNLMAQFIMIPLGLFFTAIPISPAGVGTGHAAFSTLYLLLGSQRGADVFTLFVLYKLLEGGIGGLIYLKFKGSEPLNLELAENHN